jgi:uncharacterized membrane protein
MSDQSKTAKPDTAKKGNKAEKTDPGQAAGKKAAAHRVPLLLETALTLSQLSLIVTGVSIFVMSMQAGADLTTSALRSGAALLVVGLVLWLANWLLARGSLEAVARQMREAAEAQSAAHGTLDVNA